MIQGRSEALGQTHLAASALALGGVSGFVFRVLYLSALNQADGSVLGVPWDYFAAWLVVPLLVVIPGLIGLHKVQKTRYGELGRVGFIVTLSGYAMTGFGLIVSEILFPPGHLVQALGDLMGWLAFLVVAVGWAVWGIASLRARSLPGWAVAVPLIIGLVWVGFRFPLHDFFADAQSAGEAPFRYAVHAAGLCLLAAAVWQGDRAESMSAEPEPALDRS